MGYGDFMDRITIEPGQRSDPRIRGTPITVWDVYRALSIPGMADSEVLVKYPDWLATWGRTGVFAVTRNRHGPGC
jgi:uncharacterized protein (DUF433 family)